MVAAIPITGSRRVGMIAIPAVFLTIATFTLVLRFVARKTKRQGWQIDDWLCLAALIITFGEYASLVVAVVWGGLGLPMSLIPFPNIEVVFKSMLAISQCWGTAVSLVQLSILFLYLRIFGIVRWFKIVCYVMIGVVFVWWASFFVAMLTACIPLRAYWTPGIQAKCFDMYKFAVGSTISHILMDLILVTLCMPIIWKMRTSSKNKVTVSISLILAIFATMCAIVRFATRLKKWSDPDATGTGWIGCMLDVLENSSAIICSSLPIMAATLLTRLGESRIASSLRRMLSTGGSSQLQSDSEGTSDRSRESTEKLYSRGKGA